MLDARGTAAGREVARCHQQALADLELTVPFEPTQLAQQLQHAPPPTPYRQLLLTGATGFLGCALLQALMDGSDATVTCLVRADSDEQAHNKLRHRLEQAQIAWDTRFSERVRTVAGDLAQPALGWNDARYREAASRHDAVMHAAAVVNWVMLYGQLRATNVLGTHELLRGPSSSSC